MEPGSPCAWMVVDPFTEHPVDLFNINQIEGGKDEEKDFQERCGLEF